MARFFGTKGSTLLVLAALAVSTMPTVAWANSFEGGDHAQLLDQQFQPQQDNALECEAKLRTMNGNSLYESREDMEIEIKGQSSPTQLPSMAPSESPSLSMPCSDPFSNARGSYTSTKAPCTISFHNQDEGAQPLNPLSANRKRFHDKTDDTNWAYYHGTSDLCGTENKIGEAKEYVSSWPDECVGDFARCYDLSDPNPIMCHGLKKVLGGLRDLRRLNELTDSELDTSNGLPWTTRGLHDALVPPGTTHISIDCTIDKEAILESNQQQLNLHHEMIEEQISATKRQTLFVVVSILVAVLIVVYAISQLVVQPIVGAIGEACESRRWGTENDGGNQLVSLVSRTSGLRLEATDINENVEVDQEEGTVQVEEDFEVSNEIERPRFNDAIQPISVDFDAVPIVPATIIPIEAIHAEVMEDGITYYP